MSSKRYDARVQILLETVVRPLSIQQLKFRLIGPGRFEFQLNGVQAVAPVVAIVAAERAASNALRRLGIDQYEVVKVGAELTKTGRTG